MIKKNNSPMMSNSAKEAKTLTKYKRNKTIGLFGFFAITASMVMTVYEYPAFATSGWSSLLFLMLGGMCWFIPTAICAAEMATIKQWENGGIYTWVTNMMGAKMRFCCSFFSMVSNNHRFCNNAIFRHFRSFIWFWWRYWI